jgi:hypothetical protein
MCLRVKIFSGAFSGSDTALVVAKGHVHDPMQTVLDGPAVAHDGAEFVGVEI